GALNEANIPCVQVPVYTMAPLEPAAKISPDITHILFFSKAAARYYKDHFEHIKSRIALCMSEAVKDELSVLNWKKIWVAPHPSTQGMIGYFDDQQKI